MTTAPAVIAQHGNEDQQLVSMIRTALKGARIPLNDEKVTQRYLEEVFFRLGIFFAREYRIGDGDILDFWVQRGDGFGAVLEVKMNSARPKDIVRQLERYARHELVTCMVLISNK